MFRRACIMAGVEVRYTQGFNPHPRISLPLPRSVGLEVDDDLLCIRMTSGQQTSDLQFDSRNFKTRFSAQLPQGCEILAVDFAESGMSVAPCQATYILEIPQGCIDERLTARIKNLLAAETISMRRQINAKGNIRDVDVRPYLKAVTVLPGQVAVECNISSAGSIRVEEILKLLEQDVARLAAPVRRTSILWQNN